MLACAAGIADYVVCYRSLNSASGIRRGTGRAQVMEAEMKFLLPYGCVSAAQQFALAARAHMVKYGTTTDHFGAVAVSQRTNAVLNERALFRTPLTMDDYRSSRWITEPFRLLDCCPETDGACAVVVTTAERAKDLAKRPVLISGAAWGPGQTRRSPAAPDLARSGARYISPRLYEMAGVGPQDIDVAEMYDAFTYNVVVQVEDYGLCGEGEGGPFIESGNTALGGTVPVNTHGGMLSEGYIHGFNNVCEAVQQLRGEAGDRQVTGAEVALSTGQPGIASGHTSAIILRGG
jgi:acetyl-CoA acetyltransferase